MCIRLGITPRLYKYTAVKFCNSIITEEKLPQKSSVLQTISQKVSLGCGGRVASADRH